MVIIIYNITLFLNYIMPNQLNIIFTQQSNTYY